MPIDETILNEQETQWILERRVTRLTDGKEILIYPMGAERYLSSVLGGQQKARYDLKKATEGKDLLIIPGYGNSAFLLAEAGARSITVYDKDPVTIAWVKAFKKYYNYRESSSYPSVGELLAALTCWYPPLITLPSGNLGNILLWAIYPKALRRIYLLYILSLVQQAIQLKGHASYELKREIQFHVGELHQVHKSEKGFDVVFVPYLLGVQNGIETEEEIVAFMKLALELTPHGKVLVTPSQNIRELYWAGQRYFVTTSYAKIQMIPELKPFFLEDDSHWFKTQGLAVFKNR